MFSLFKKIKIISNKFAKRICSKLPTTNYQLPTSNGFMLVEMIVSVAIFSVVMTVGIGSLLTIINANKRAQAFKTVANNLNLAMESMSRDLKTGYDYMCGSLDCSGGNYFISFKSKSGDSIKYRHLVSGEKGVIEKWVYPGPWIAITSPEIDIDNLKFYILGNYDPSTQPKVLIVLKAHSGEREKSQIEFDLQTTISQRKR